MNFLKQSNTILKSISTTPFKQNLFKNKNVLITGGGTGLGKQMAKTYLDLGANVLIASRKSKVLQETCNEFGNTNISYKVLNVKEHEGVKEFVNELDILPDIVINNAAGNFICPSKDLSYNGWNSILDIVLKGTMDLTLQLGQRMINEKKTGNFLNISTTYANTGSGYVLPSAVAKAGCDNLTKSLGAEWGKYGIRLNSVAPGPIFTEGAFTRLDPSGQFRKKAESKLPMGRLGEPLELANLVCFITSDHMNWMTGQIINLDGGEVVSNSGEFNFLKGINDTQWKIFRKL
jgi:2,4-dienoyl-CoA reductase [(3E)-enoyl-CoA-producing], mitochondrial